jgi:hypothetical protein
MVALSAKMRDSTLRIGAASGCTTTGGGGLWLAAEYEPAESWLVIETEAEAMATGDVDREGLSKVIEGEGHTRL